MVVVVKNQETIKANYVTNIKKTIYFYTWLHFGAVSY